MIVYFTNANRMYTEVDERMTATSNQSDYLMNSND